MSTHSPIQEILPAAAPVSKATFMASQVNGKAIPSFMPASAVNEKRTLSLDFSNGGPTCTSEASTGSVGASTAPINKAAEILKSRKYQQQNVTAAMHRIIVKKISRKGTRQALNENG